MKCGKLADGRIMLVIPDRDIARLWSVLLALKGSRRIEAFKALQLLGNRNGLK